MSYCRFDEDCDVYMYASVYGGYTFHLTHVYCDKNPTEPDTLQAETRQEALEIFKKLKEAGARFPEDAVTTLEGEIAAGEPEHQPDPDGFR